MIYYLFYVPHTYTITDVPLSVNFAGLVPFVVGSHFKVISVCLSK